MKKILLLSGLIIATAGIVQAFPTLDMTVGGAPFGLLQEQEFERTEIKDFNMFKNDKRETEEAKQRVEYQQRQEQNDFKRFRKPSKIQLKGSNMDTTTPQEPDNSGMELIQEDGKVKIQYK